MDGVHGAVENYVNSMTELQTIIDNFQKTILAEVHRLVKYQSNWVPDGDSLHAHNGPRYVPDDPTLPQPWKGLIDGSSGSIYYWNTETNVTQYEKPKTTSFLPTDHYHCVSAPPFPNTNYNHNFSLTHPTVPHPSYHFPPFATSAYPSESDYGYLSSLPYPSDQPFSCDPYSTSPHNSSYSPITYPHTEPNESIVHPYQLPNAADLIPPSALAYTARGTSCTEKAEVPLPEMKKSLRHNLKMRSHVMMKRKPRSQFPRKKRTQNNGGSEGDLCKAPLLMAVNWDSTVLSNKSLDSVSELTILDLVVKNGFISTSHKDAPMFLPGDDVDAVSNQLLGSDELYQTERAKDILLLAGFWQILDKKGPMVDWELRSIHTEAARLYLNLSWEKPITNLGNSSLVNHFCHLVIDVGNFSLVTNLISGLQPTLLSMSFVELPVILVVPLPDSYQHGVKHEVVEFNQFMVCSFAVRELIKTLRVAHLAHLRATLYNWKAGVQNVLSCSKGGFEYDIHLENLIESLTRHYRDFFVNIHGKGIEHKCYVMYHCLPSSNWNQVFLFGQGINFQYGFSFIGKHIVCLHYNLCFPAEMHFLGVITSFIQIGLESIMQTFSHTWDLQIHQLQICWITIVNVFTATLSHGLDKENLVVIFGISSGTIDLPSLVMSNDQFEVMVTSKDQRVKLILIAMETHVQCLSFLFDLNSKNKVIAFVIEICNQERHTGKDKHDALDDIRASTVVMCAPLLVENVTALVTLRHNNEVLDDIDLVAFVYISFVVFQHSHFPREVKLLDVVEFPRDSMMGNALATFWLYGVTAMSSLKGWVPHIPSLIEMLIKALIGGTQLIFATESYMPPTAAIATGFVFNFGAASSVTTSDINMDYSTMCLPHLQELFIEIFAVELLPYCYSMDAGISWCSPLWDLTFGQPSQSFQFSVQLDFQVTTVLMHMYLRSHGSNSGLLIFTSYMTQHMFECGILQASLSNVAQQLHLDVISLLSFGSLYNEMAYKEVSLVTLATDWSTVRTHVVDKNVRSFLITTIVGKAWAPLCTFKIPEHNITRNFQGDVSLAVNTLCAIRNKSSQLIDNFVTNFVGSMTLVLSMLAFIVLRELPVGKLSAILVDCSTLHVVFYFTEAVIMEVRQLASQSTTLTLCALALPFSAAHTKIAPAEDMINTVDDHVILDALITFNMLPNGSCRYGDAKVTLGIHDGMLTEGAKFSDSLIPEDPSYVAIHTEDTQLEDIWFNFSLTYVAVHTEATQLENIWFTIIRHEDMPHFKGGGMIGSLWLWTCFT